MEPSLRARAELERMADRFESKESAILTFIAFPATRKAICSQK
jgi:hypothetical protein